MRALPHRPGLLAVLANRLTCPARPLRCCRCRSRSGHLVADVPAELWAAAARLPRLADLCVLVNTLGGDQRANLHATAGIPCVRHLQVAASLETLGCLPACLTHLRWQQPSAEPSRREGPLPDWQHGLDGSGGTQLSRLRLEHSLLDAYDGFTSGIPQPSHAAAVLFVLTV